MRISDWSSDVCSSDLPPPPYIPPGDEHAPFALAAVELAEEQIVILGQVAAGYGVDDLRVGAPVELVVEPLYEIDGVEHLVHRGKPAHHAGAGSRPRRTRAPCSVPAITPWGSEG